uniref:ATP synthase protein 8 n=1 Tax=Calonectria ilicicola TaxID=182845 RepID=A0A6G7MXL1_9HYPO|nr:ATP synthase F0 subunit 8 [Calonectria ilicicola]QIJ45880.1 ATP synthase F0 subunit 8 [Calonectria ilicicola]QIJ45886.1 ATP synthase F0 subunit 8 [Calonectria ilicicola]QIJ45936.1 ATP synthase F0 subunit 8 [Calonectria ilicicola]QIJ45950.1 ATP synthase F0 subunit 8 [Calonectria ilicicola]QIJ45979.1 ATP synthase F0 subunit 8 [Calonectria ilicicola]
MPQLVPFYYMNEVVFAFAIIVTILYVLSKYILPRIVRLFLSRMFINKI